MKYSRSLGLYQIFKVLKIFKVNKVAHIWAILDPEAYSMVMMVVLASMVQSPPEALGRQK